MSRATGRPSSAGTPRLYALRNLPLLRGDLLGGAIDYAMLAKEYGNPDDKDHTAKARYSPDHCISSHVIHVSGRPDPEHINTSYVKRHNLTIRMSMRRFFRPTIAFSRKLENHAAGVALYAYYHNFIKRHRSFKSAIPAMAAGLASWRKKIEDVVRLLDRDYERPPPRPRRTRQEAREGGLTALSSQTLAV